MFPQVSKQQLLALSAALASNATATAILDTLGHDFVSIGVGFSTVSATTPELTLKIGEADVTNTSSFVDIDALKGGTGFTIPTPPTNTSVANTIQFDVDTRHRKRYLLVTVTPFTTKNVAIWASLGKPAQGPIAATSDNLMARVSA
jgi:hypothetical protein